VLFDLTGSCETACGTATGIDRVISMGGETDRDANIQLHARVEPVADEWDALADRAASVPWARPGWFRAWYDAFAPGEAQVITLRRGSALVGVVPLTSRRGVVRAASNWHTPEFRLIADSDALEQLAGAVMARRPHRIALQFVDSDEAGTRACRAAAEDAGYSIQVRTLERSPYIETGGDWDAYTRGRNGKLLRELGRRRRRLEAEGRFAFEVHDGSERLEELLEEGFRVEAAGWKAAAGSAIASQPATRRFYSEIGRWAAARDWLRLAFLRLDSRPFAFDFGLQHDGVHYLLKTGYDPAYGRFAPGMLLRREMIARAFDEGLRSYEFLGADEPWKLEWTNTVRERVLFQAFAPTLRGRLERRAFAYGRPLAKRALALAGR
jgi:CelD/BcsL family acetyltransferase involved in cellulose biosynthesis